MDTITKSIINKSILSVAVDNAAELSVSDKTRFAQIRRSGLGGSDSSIVLGVNKWTTPAQLIEQKRSAEITEEELAIGEKPQVRMGADLEPLILQKFSEWAGGMPVHKPKEMFRFIEHPYLTVNYDGMTDNLIPVEAKCISMFADKVWNKSTCINSPLSGIMYRGAGSNIVEHVNELSEAYGIPPYYFTQCQQEMMGVDAESCFLAAMFVKDWTLRVYRIYKDKWTQDAIVEIGHDIWEAIKVEA